jgi:hypothetical protein
MAKTTQKDLSGNDVPDNTKSLFDKFGVDKEAFEKSKDILPTLDLGKLSIGSRAKVQFIDSYPKEIETNSKFSKGKVLTRAIRVHCYWIERHTETGVLTVPMEGDYTLWLSSKSLSMSLLKIANEQPEGDLMGVSVVITVSLAEYKDYGENRCYNAVRAVE